MSENNYKQIAKWLKSKCCKCKHLKWEDGVHYCDISPSWDVFECVKCSSFEKKTKANKLKNE